MFGNRVVVPSALRARVLDLLHQGHPGIVRMKLLARSHVWWPNMSTDIENRCQKCSACSVINFSPKHETLPWPTATEPFERIFIDFFELEQSTYLIFCDSFSKWIGAYLMTKTSACDVSLQCMRVFSIWGLPATIVADNGPPFASVEFTQFCTSLNIQLVHPAAHHPDSDSYGERAVQTIKKSLKKEILQAARPEPGKKLNLECILLHVLFSYNTPSTATDKSPNSMLLCYVPRTSLSVLHPTSPIKHRSVRPFKDGDIVLVRYNTKHPVEATVVRQISPTMFLLDVDGVIKQAHMNQMAHGPLIRSDPLQLPRFLSKKR